MKKIIVSLLILLLSNVVYADVGVFPIQATLPAATQVKFLIADVTPGNPPTFSAHQIGNNTLSFDAANVGMQFSSTTGAWTGKKFFAIDLSPSDGTGNPAPANYGSVAFVYGNNTVPAGQVADEGLNKRGTITVVKVVGAQGSQTEQALISARAIGVGSIPSVTSAQASGGFLRIYVGLSTGEQNNGVPVASNSVPFTNADKPGTYTGTLTITATLL